MKRVSGFISAALLAAAFLTQGASAAIGDICIETPGVAVPPVQDGIIGSTEYGSAMPLILDGSGANTEGTWAGTSWGTEIFSVYSAWDTDNLYIGVMVQGDTTNNQDGCPSAGENTCPFGKCDSLQLGFNPGAIVTGQHPILFCIGLSADGIPYIHADAYRSEIDGEQSVEYTGKLSAFSSTYQAGDINYVMEIAIPWDELCVKGAGRAEEGANVFDMTGEREKIGTGYELPFFFVYTDKDADDNNIFIRTDVTTGESWKAEGMGSIAFVLGEAPATETNAETDTDIVTSAEMQTEDSTPYVPATRDYNTLPAMAAALVSICTAWFACRKKR